MIKRVLTVIIVVIAGILCFKYWKYIWPVIAGIIGLFFISQGKPSDREKLREIQEKEKELDRDAEDRRKKAEALAKEDEEQKGKVEDWRERKERWKSRKSGGLILILFMLLIAASPARAEVDSYADLTREELIEALIEAEELLDEADRRLAREEELKEQYKVLYLETEEDLRVAREFSGQKDEIITDQGREIEFLRYRLERKSQAWGLTGGVELGESVRWKLGIARKKEWLSYSGGVGGGDNFSVWGGVTVWWYNPF